MKKKKSKGFLWFVGVSAFSVLLLLSCQFFFENTLTGNERFFENTKINGIDVGGMTTAEAENVVLSDMLDARKDIEIKLNSKDKTWTLSGNDFEVSNKIEKKVEQFSKFGHNGNFFQNLRNEKQTIKNGKEFKISYINVLSNIDDKIDEIVLEVEKESTPASLVFLPDEEEVFDVDLGQNAVFVNRDKLYNEIENMLLSSKKISVEIPIVEIENEIDVESLKSRVGLRGEFETNYEKSSPARKNNIKTAIGAFNGMIVEPGQTVSFNETTGIRDESAGYKKAHIIVGGQYVDGVGGGVCQASTTLYNALLLSDVEILSVNHHTLPASYVPLSFDAMVSGGYSDLVFKNNFDFPLYIKTYANDSVVGVKIYGQKLEEGEEIKTRSELVKVLPHKGDKILSDLKGEYANKVLYKGEYYRLKYPREGYESKGYIQYFKDGKLVCEKEIRHDFYQAQDGVVVEGVEQPAPGMTIPVSDVKIVKPQKISKESEENVSAKLEKTNPSELSQ